MWKFACRNLASRPARSALSLMGLTVAIAGMVGLFSVKTGLERSVERTFQLIPGLSIMQPGAPVPLFSRLPAEWGNEIADIDGVAVVNPQIITRANLVDGKPSISPPTLLVGVDIPSRLQLQKAVYRESVIEGRFLEESDRGTGNAIFSRHFVEKFQRQLGETIDIDGQKMQIVGIYHTGLALLDVAVILDIAKVRTMTRLDPGLVSCFYVEKNGADVDDETLKGKIEEQFQGRELVNWKPSGVLDVGELKTGNPLIDVLLWLAKRFNDERPAANESPSQESSEPALPIEVRSADDWGEKIAEFSADLGIFLTIMTSIGISIAVLSIINTMLMSVTERIIEFGILKANGWSRGDVMKLITYESATIGLVGGLLGAFFGWLATQGINSYWPDKIQLFASPGLLTFSIVFSTIVGILGGLYPAIWAMRMMPMEAIRRG